MVKGGVCIGKDCGRGGVGGKCREEVEVGSGEGN